MSRGVDLGFSAGAGHFTHAQTEAFPPLASINTLALGRAPGRVARIVATLGGVVEGNSGNSASLKAPRPPSPFCRMVAVEPGPSNDFRCSLVTMPGCRASSRSATWRKPSPVAAQRRSAAIASATRVCPSRA